MKSRIACCVVVAALGGCVTLPPDAFVVTPEQLKQRQLETRRYSGIKEHDLIIACSNVLQDLGFTIENSETKLGLVTAEKQRDAKDPSEITTALFMALLGVPMPFGQAQTFRVSLVVRPVQATKDSKPVDEYFVRVTFQRIVRMSDGTERLETLRDPEVLEGFFAKLSKSIFLEGQKV